MNIKRYILIAALLVLTILVAGCQPAAPAPTEAVVAEPPTAAPTEAVATEPPAEATEAPAPEPTQEPTQEEVAEEPVTLRFFIPDGGGRPNGYEKVIEAYKAIKPNVTVELEVIPFSDFYGQLPVMWASNDPADIAVVDSCDVKSYAHNGVLASLDDIFTAEDTADMNPGMVEEASLNGTMYGAPFLLSTQGVFYNVDMFEAAGIEVPQSIDDAWTWEQYVENVTAVVENEKAQGRDVWGLVFLTNPPNIDMWTHLIVRSFGEAGSPTFMAVSEDGLQVQGYLDTPEAMEAYKFWQSLYVDLKLAPQSTVPDAFGTQQAATMISFAAWGSVLNANFPDLNWGVMPLPYEKTHIVHLGEFVPVVSEKGKNVQAAKDFVKFLASAEGVLAYNEATTMLPVRQSLVSQLPAFQEYPLKIFSDQMAAWGVPRPMTVGHAIYNRIFGQMMVDIAQGADIDSTVANAVMEIDAQLEQYK